MARNLKYDDVFVENFVAATMNGDANYIAYCRCEPSLQDLYQKVLDKTLTKREYNNLAARVNNFKTSYKDRIIFYQKKLSKKVGKTIEKEIAVKAKHNIKTIEKYQQMQVENQLTNDLMLAKILDIYKKNDANGMIQLKAIELYYKITSDMKKYNESNINNNGKIFNISFKKEEEEEDTNE